MKLLARALCAIALILVSCLAIHAQVPVSLAPVPRITFLSASGVPLAGGFVKIFCAGTSAQCPSYLDSSGSAMATNPVTLDGGGQATIWLPVAPVDIEVDNSSGVQQYKILNVTALPSTVSSLTAGYFQSSTINPALSGFLRMAATDQVCWRNPGNSADNCLSQNGSGSLLFASHPFAFLDTTQSWTAPQTFSAAGLQEISSGGSFIGTFIMGATTANQSYTFPNGSGSVCISATGDCTVTNPIINGVTISGAPTGANQTLISTSPTAATWGIGSILDYDNYSCCTGVSLPIPVTANLQVLPIGAVEAGGPVGSFVEAEFILNNVTYTGSAPAFSMTLNGTTIATFTAATSTSYDIKVSLALSSNRDPETNVNIFASTPTTTTTYTGGLTIPPINGTATTIFGYSIATATTVTYSFQMVHIRVRY